jgi:microcin C transport system substrate-binding protein
LALASSAILTPAFAQAPDAQPPASPAVEQAPAAAPAASPEATPAPAAAKRHHALSLVGEPKYGADFDHFDWVNPDAPKGGTLRGFVQGSYDSLNGFTVRGDAAGSLGLIYDSLLVGSIDEPSTEYGQIAEWVTYPDDYSSATFGLRPEARWHDGQPITPDDVIFSLEALKKAHPQYAFYYKNVVKAEKTGEHEVTFTFDSKGNRELPQIVGQLTVLPKHFWEGKGSNGEPRDITKTMMEVPLGSGPYKIKSFDPGRSVTYERVKDYWGKDLPVSKGQWNFDEIKLVYFLDRTPAFEEFKSGKLDFWRENQASQWATAYNFPAVKNGWVKKEAIRTEGQPSPIQGFVMNQRRKQFQDPRVRQAFNLAYNFEEANKKLFFDLYQRTRSYFDNSDLASSGLPQGRELEILNEVKDQVPPEVFTTEWKNSVNSTPEDFRNHLREASTLLDQAGWTLQQQTATENDTCGFFCKAMRTVGMSSAPKENVRRNAQGDILSVEFLLESPEFERIVLPYIQSLNLLGIKARARVIDSAQYKRRTDSYDFDIVVENFPQSNSPGNEQRDFWGSASADRDGSRNAAGIKNPAIDKIIDKIVFAKDRDELVAATHALDRVLLWNYYLVPHWNYPYERLVTWDIFGRPKTLPRMTAGLTQVWWIDPDKEKALADKRGK